MVTGELGQPQLTVSVSSYTHAAVTHVLQMLVVERAAAHPDTSVGALVVISPGDAVLARDNDVTVVAGDDESSSLACASVALRGVSMGIQQVSMGSSGLTAAGTPQ